MPQQISRCESDKVELAPNISRPDYCLEPRAGEDSSADESGEDGFEIEATIDLLVPEYTRVGCELCVP